MFVDLVEISVKSGHGGPGCIAFRREKFVPKGGPSGGDGGRGGSVYIQVSDSLNTLLDLRYRPHYKAQNGQPGKGSDKNGLAGEDVIIKIPPGTMVYNAETDELICDLVTHGEKYLIAVGGKGGRGNVHFKSPTNQSPRTADPGYPCEEMKLRLELKLIADVGLVGYPNAGKSSLLKAMSRAKPKIADYPFTTLSPNIGIVEIVEYETIKMADIPGIITGASTGKGLGFTFLRHIERTKILLYILDGTKDDFLDDFRILQNELQEYNWRLPNKPTIVCVNKIDLWDDETFNHWKNELEDQFLFISAKESTNLDSVRKLLAEKMNELSNEDSDE